MTTTPRNKPLVIGVIVALALLVFFLTCRSPRA